jgi:uncharacterized oligopeptide transporter (OPT) family protein
MLKYVTILRVWSFALLALCILLVGLYFCLDKPVAGVALFTFFATSVVLVVGAVAGKSTLEHLKNGTGLNTIFKTDSK